VNYKRGTNLEKKGLRFYFLTAVLGHGKNVNFVLDNFTLVCRNITIWSANKH